MGLQIRGLFNIQFVVYQGQVLVLEVNPRSSRTVPFLSKITDIPMVDIAVRAMLGESIESQGYQPRPGPSQAACGGKSAGLLDSPSCAALTVIWVPRCGRPARSLDLDGTRRPL